MIFDTDVLIWFFRGNEKAKKMVRENMPFSISAVSYMELLQGALNKQELLGIKKFINQSKTSIITINDEITHLAMEYVENYALSDSMELADALIAAASVVNDETLCTANGKHYKCIPELQMSVFKVE
ncbi:MAG: type II toxin-antitoxin system VapC family toxin [Treponema sp.]|nr:type II toxin-antitoxin system VapC family toxin [Treponema sp.]